MSRDFKLKNLKKCQYLNATSNELNQAFISHSKIAKQ